ncbi:AAA domain-containing protein [Ectobacillus antri]|uniref:AAA domain-containing protein n=1 Tax=Ectobacillus antri TaxID=2486280 RepID=A0ABT6H6P6_9BACI|nr:AAA domain-containing protein [Ectobacillus antri]MDG4657713.1 AAA domain-containing protein [Ectobacillus antri]MDG5754720.1 AAA domain-containing protein [Ectobacillus antri]
MSAGKIERLFQYLIAVNDLGSKVIRRYSEYDFTLQDRQIKEAENCRLFPQNEDVWLEVHKVYITNQEKMPPLLPIELEGWLQDDPNDYKKATIRFIEEKEGESFHNTTRPDLYTEWLSQWQDWKERLLTKLQAKHIYDEFFKLYQRFEREGERLELVFGTGILTWQKDEKIEHPLLTIRMELEFLADQGLFLVKPAASGLQMELEVLSGYPIPNVTQIQDMADTWRDMEPSAALLASLEMDFIKFMHFLDAEGEFVAEGDISVHKTPKLFNRFLFLLREKNQRVLKQDLERILEKTQSGELIPPASIRSLVGEPVPSSDSFASEWEEVGKELFFPLPANEDQQEIARRIAQSYGVSVQGPPGTGKSHTIANLVSHLLAHGKKVLITSQKESPLRVLRDKIPASIQSLCVPVLGGSRDSLREVEKAVQAISENLGSMDISKLTREIQEAKIRLDESKRKEAQTKTKLKQYEMREQEALQWRGKDILRAEAAQILQQSSVDSSWIQDTLSPGAVPPLATEEFYRLWQLRGELNAAHYRTLAYTFPQQLVTVEQLKEMLAEGSKLEELVKQVKQRVTTEFSFTLQPQEVDAALSIIDQILLQHAPLTNSAHQAILQDIERGGARKETWEEFVREVEAGITRLIQLNKELSAHEIQLPQKPLFELQQHITKAKEAMQNGKPGMLYFFFKGKDIKYLFTDPVINQKPVTTLEELQVLETYITSQDEKEKLLRKWNNVMSQIGGSQIGEPAVTSKMDDELQLVKSVFALQKRIEELRQSISLPAVDWKECSTYESLQAALVHKKQEYLLQDWQQQYNAYTQELLTGSKQPNAHHIWDTLRMAWEQKNVDAWQAALENLEQLRSVNEMANELHRLLAKLKASIPQTALWLEQQLGTQLEMPDWNASWQHKILHDWLHELDHLDADELAEQLKQERRLQQKLTEEIVAKSSWRNQLDNITEEQKRALSAWKTYITRYGKGTGKNAAMNLREAQREMAKCQGAIPVWIMPIQQVLENFPVTNEPFDVVIVDESSQCNIMSLPVLMRAKRVIVVGDDEQISPYDIGTKSDDITYLVQQFLQGIPNARLFDLQISLYDIADQIFPKAGRLMLKEHFRCVPEIIQFSNDLSYHGKMIPLRLPTAAEMITPPVLAVRVEDGYCTNGTDATNKPEAEKIVQDIAALLKNPAYDGQTIGVIALQGNKQSDLIESMLRNTIGEKKMIERKIRCGNAYAFQGDERDIMFLSMVIAPNRTYNALTTKSAQQIFNVAASRARNQLRLYHSVGLEELKQHDFRHRLLAYCQNPARVREEMENLEAKCDSPFEVEVLRRIIAKGYRVMPQVQVAGRRIDLVVEGLRNRLAVECDGEKFHPIELWEADMERQHMLERLGWTFWRVRGRDFYQNPDKAMESLWEKLAEMDIHPYAQQTPVVQESVVETEQTKQTAHDLFLEKVSLTKQQLREKVFRPTHIRRTGVEVEAVVLHDEAGQEHVIYRDAEGTVIGPITLQDFMRRSRVRNTPAPQKVAPVRQLSVDKVNGDNIVAYLQQEGVKIVDHREKGGALWVVGGKQLATILAPLEQRRISFRYMPSGAKATSNLPAWFWVGETILPKKKPEPKQLPKLTHSQEQEKVIRFEDETLYLPPQLQNKKLRATDFPGCQHLINGLQHVYQVERIGDLPLRADLWHEGIRGAGQVASRKLWDQLVQLVKQDGRPRKRVAPTVSAPIHPRALSFGDRVVIVPEKMWEDNIHPFEFATCVQMAQQLIRQGYVYYKDLPNRIEELMRIRGLGAKTAENIYHHIMQRVQYEKQWEVLDASLLSYYNWFVEYITDEQKLFGELGITKEAYELLQLRYKSYKNSKILTLHELAEMYGYTEYWVRQLLNKTMLALYAPARPWLLQLQKELDNKTVTVNTFLEPNEFSHYIALELLNQHGITLQGSGTMLVKE